MFKEKLQISKKENKRQNTVKKSTIKSTNLSKKT